MDYKEEAVRIADIIINKATGKNGLACQKIDSFNGSIVVRKSNVDDLGDYVQYIIWLGKLLKRQNYIEYGKNQILLAEKYCKTNSGLYNANINVDDINQHNTDVNILYTNNTDALIGMIAAADITKDASLLRIAMEYADSIKKSVMIDNNIAMVVMPRMNYKIAISEPMTTGNYIEEMLNLYRITGNIEYVKLAESIAGKWLNFDYFKKHKFFARMPLNNASKMLNKVHDTIRMIMIDMNVSKKKLSYSRPMLAKQNTHLVFGLLKLYKQTGKEEYKKTVIEWFENIMNKMLAADGKFYSFYNIRESRPRTISLIENHSMVELLIDMYMTFKEQRFLDIARRCVDSWLKESIDGLLPRNPGLNIAELDPEVDMCVNLIKIASLTKDKKYLNEAEKLLEAINKYHKTEYGYSYSVDMISKQKLSNEINIKNLALALKPLLLIIDNKKLFKDEALMNILRDR